MKTPLTIHRSLPLILVLAFALALAFLGTAQAGPLDELTDIFTPARAGITDCSYRRLLRVLVDDAGNIFYTFLGERGFTQRLAANINDPAGPAMLQILLAASSGTSSYIAVAGHYPAGYDCTRTNLTTPAKLLAIDRIGL